MGSAAELANGNHLSFLFAADPVMWSLRPTWLIGKRITHRIDRTSAEFVFVEVTAGNVKLAGNT